MYGLSEKEKQELRDIKDKADRLEKTIPRYIRAMDDVMHEYKVLERKYNALKQQLDEREDT